MATTLAGVDLEVAKTVLNNLMSDKYKDTNYLFVQPFDLEQVPGYMDVVDKKLDLETVSKNLEAGAYADKKDEFWSDFADVFNNAIKYHANKPSKWIGKFAKEMIKAMNKERKSVEKKLNSKKKGSTANAEQSAKTSLKLKLPTKQKKNQESEQNSSKTKPKISLKLKLPTKQNTEQETVQQQETKTQATSSKTGAKSIPAKGKATQSKFKLKLSIGNKKTKTTKSSNKATTTKQSQKDSQIATADTASTSPVNQSPPSRGKELPKAVAAKRQATKKSKTTKTKKDSATTTSVSNSGATTGFSLHRQRQASKVLAGLRRRQQKNISWFLNPVSDKNILKDYRAKIKHPMDLSKITAKLENRNDYKTLQSFCLDLRRIFANCLRFNTSIQDGLRPVAIEVLETTEQLLAVFILQDESTTQQQISASSKSKKKQNSQLPYPPLLYCWKMCLQILDKLYNLVNPTDGQPTALYFLHPVSVYCGGEFPPDYLQKISKPMDFSSVTGNLLEGRYESVDEFATDCRLIISNCNLYYSGREDGKLYVEQANRLNESLSPQLDQLVRYDKSAKGTADRLNAVSAAKTMKLDRPPVQQMLSTLEDLRKLKYTDKATKITEPAMGPFEKPVSLTLFPDYMQHIQEPIDLQSIERRAKADMYETPEDFEFDCNLTFRNCEVYNSSRNGDHFVSMAKYASRNFRRIFYANMVPTSSIGSKKNSKRPSSALSSAEQTPSGVIGAPPTKKSKVDPSSSTGSVPKLKSGTRISITAAQVSSAAFNKSPSSGKQSTKSLGGKKASNTMVSQQQKLQKKNQPVPLHIAIARVKETFRERRPVKSLQSWEADCARYFKELMRHPWITTARPKFIFHVPVPILFPDLKSAYEAKIRKPMDLTTIECTLLAGNRYTGPEEFVEDIALVFANAIQFNKDGRDIGDPLSCAYYDASVHLLRYSRWMSMELLSKYVVEDDYVDDAGPDGLPPLAWKLTTGNRKKAREEMSQLVLSEPIEKSLEGDRWTWHEAECEKLLKALRHQSDSKLMHFFVQTQFPPDYAAYISKPMDWDKVQRHLKKRQYDKFGDVVDDLRLIFSNALKYNERLKGTETVSGRVYDSATQMSAKLELAVNKLLLSVADRLERERIDHANAEREIEAAERAEEVRIQAAWKKEPDSKEGSLPLTTKSDSGVQMKIRIGKKVQHRESTDFEIPFFDETDNGQHARSYFEVVKLQKSMFEMQRQERSKMQEMSVAVGANIYGRMLQNRLAVDWMENEAKKAKPQKEASTSTGEAAAMNVDGISTLSKSLSGKDKSCVPIAQPSAILNHLEKKGRSLLQIKFKTPNSKKTVPGKHKRPRLMLE